jgi:hypothetical protein
VPKGVNQKHTPQFSRSNRVIEYNPDGTFTIYYGPKSACGNVANWLDTPGDNWYLGLRVYRPFQEGIDGNYKIPEPELVERQFSAWSA